MAATHKNGDYPAISQLINTSVFIVENSKYEPLSFGVFQILYRCKDELGH